MSIDNVLDRTPRDQYTALAAQDDFSYSFPIFEDGDLVVDVDGATKALGTHYTVTGEGDDTGGTVHFLTPMTGGEAVTIYRDLPIERTSDFQTNGPLRSSTFNDELDRITMILQQLESQIGRSIRLALTNPQASDQLELEPLSTWADKYLFINSDGELEPSTAIALTTLTKSVVRSVLTDSGYRYIIHPAETSAGIVTADLTFGFDPGDARRYGASPLATSAVNRVALQRALDSSTYVRIPEAYTINAALVLRSNQVLDLGDNGSIILANGFNTEKILTGTSLTNVRIIGGRITGNGSPGFANILLTSCTNVIIDGVISTKAGAHGVQLEACSNCTVRDCDLSQNYFYGVSDRDGAGNRYICTRFSGNGATGVATSTGGRGVNLWRCVGCYVVGSRFVGNNEYGYRIYSEAADVSSSYGNVLQGCYFEDNASCDILHYDESLAGTLVLKNIIADCIVQRSTNPSLGTAVLLHGGDNHIKNVHVFKDGTIGNCPAFYFFHAVRVWVSNCSATNWQDMFAFSTVTDCVVENCLGRIIATVGGLSGIIGSGQVIRDCKFTHGGVGASDVALPNYNATGRNYIEGNLFDGFHTGVYIDVEAVTLRDNKTLNSTFAGFRKDNNAQVGQEILGNVWDSASPALLLHLQRRTVGTAQLYSSAAPASLTWAVGDQCFNTAPAAAGTPGWVCTTAGSPGTWKARANVAA